MIPLACYAVYVVTLRNKELNISHNHQIDYDSKHFVLASLHAECTCGMFTEICKFKPKILQLQYQILRARAE
jgi:hypothetical protein